MGCRVVLYNLAHEPGSGQRLSHFFRKVDNKQQAHKALLDLQLDPFAHP